ncbi:Alpha/Beta hydrolase protein [Parachaetomium inaequale]|uniref:Alpha/Beta hydrolase protein n=1 Tax=Parachaetomium inaequale TaxID=2588326 RepID=A0AAN6SLI3_9PEZI|nr:Alpha/Beta hydrolase protein [Parachaetomium inaequale]
MEAADLSETIQLVASRLPLSKRIKYAIISFLWSKLILKPMLYYSEAKKYFVSPGEKEPDLVKAYPARKSLAIRIFFPPSYKPSASSPKTTKLPTLITAHGGGFTVGEPHDNDSWNRAFAKRHGFLVVALNYHKAPASPFPTAIYDVEALIGCILSDSSLPVDTNRVAVAGWSAGGNLTLTASQLPSLQGKIHAAIPLYSLVDSVPRGEVKAKGRRYKPALGGFRAKDSDFNIFMIACEMDMMAHEAWRMACKLAGKRIPALDEPVGCGETVGKGKLMTKGDERFAWEETIEDGSRYKWLLVPDTIHGFDQDNIEGLTGDPVFMEDARIKTAKTIDLIGEWLLSGPLKADS